MLAPEAQENDVKNSESCPSRLRVVVAALTRLRPKMLERLLKSWTEMALPPRCDVTFVVIENNSTPASEQVVLGYSSLLPAPIFYKLELRPGIPMARNAAVDLALGADADLLLFVDDDEVVDRNWLVEMVAEYRNTGAVLIGGPVEAVAEAEALSFWRSQMLRGVQFRYKMKAARNFAAFSRRHGARTAIVTNNWLAHTDLFRKFNLRFDEDLAISGGSDTSFDKAVSERGLKKSWAKDALVLETLPASRLSFRYQFRRSRDQSIVSTRRKLQSNSATIWATIPVLLVLRLGGMMLWAISMPLVGGPAVVGFARSAGWLCGRLLGLIGFESRHYERVTGG